MHLGGYNNYRILLYEHGKTDAPQFYQELKAIYDAGLHILVHIHLQSIDLGVHSHKYIMQSDSFEVHDMHCDYGTELLHLRRFVFKPTEVIVNAKTIDLSKIALL